jgi:PIN domain nuclease of toxin-antitoxin system
MILLDTCALIWIAADPASLSTKARGEIDDPANELFCSAISAWEIGIAHAKRRLALERQPTSWFAGVVRRHHVRVVAVSWQIALASTQLPKHHNDPADRIIIATAIARDLRIISPDPEMPKYEQVRIIW